MKTGVNTRALGIGVFGVGVLVTLLESACTAQLYLPMMTVLFRHGGLTFYTFMMLALYNLACIVPLVAVFCATLYGMKSIKLASFANKHIFWSKLGLGILFLLLAVILILLS